MQEEIVLGVYREKIDKYLIKNFIEDENLYNIILDNISSMERHIAEENKSFKQIIPYLFIKCNDEYLVYRRTKKQTEGRLHEKLSLGIGGHINPIDTESHNIITGGLERELIEELGLNTNDSLKFIGFINDDSNEVGKVHLGVVFKMEIDNKIDDVVEKQKMTLDWYYIDQIYTDIDRFETWSQILFRNLISTEK
ncbi:hypothetical protein [Chryseobacterium salviniae]|uniref:Nudix hydrolase domain-containing protein n=1 Tax=Chryseobacterium salviniae TaxID=3101750 RepID=A0ABU6HWC5_9FLAO|nr:hypothetical protein [Chryseobacterium sp. T9W2-O]MEC3876247.1 hypothetical protein [Chryseobacterium sp. T9W2-O]